MEPSTPPGRDVFPATPSTPRHGPFEEEHHPVKPQHFHKTTRPVKTPTRLVARQLLMTPRTTPHRRILFPPTTPIRGSGRQGKRLFAPIEPAANKAVDAGPAVYTRQTGKDEPTKEGMWYVFRGKKVFRPFAEEEEPMQPRKLFDLAPQFQAKSQAESEEDTDVE